MVSPVFEHFSPSRLLIGRGAAGQLGEVAASLGTLALVVYNGGEPGEAGALHEIPAFLGVAGVRAVYSRQSGEPTTEDVDRHLDAARRSACDVVVGIGGGSAIDAAKAVAGLLANAGAALDYLEVVGKGRKLTQPAMPWIAVPTTAGTGAEATRNAVIGYPPARFKASIRSPLLLPRVALIDAELGVGVPPAVTARSGMDALCQCIEAYTSTGAQPITDALALRGVHLAARALRRAYHDGADLDAREDMAIAALLSGMALTNAGLGAVHGFAAPLGASFPAPHGAICAALLPGVIAANVAALRNVDEAHPTLARYADVGRALADDADLPAAAAIDAASRITAELSQEFGIPPLGAFGLTSADVPGQVALARKASSMRFNPIALSDETLMSLLTAAIG